MKNSLNALLFTLLVSTSDFLITHTFWPLQSGLFLLLILFITHFCRRFRLIYGILIGVGFIHYLFYRYFLRPITPTDITLFFTHMEETWESFVPMISLFVLPFMLLIVGVLFLWWISTIPTLTRPLTTWIKYPTLFLLTLLNLNAMMGMQLIDAFTSLASDQPKPLYHHETPLYPQRVADTNIVLLIGESMRYDPYVESKLKTLGFFYQAVYSGATNTDVAVPLLLNTKNNPLELNSDNESNLFRLAKRNRFNTTFISIQSEKSLQYIKPYLQTSQIDSYKSYTKEERKPAFDFLLLEHLKQTDWSQRHFIVMQQIGQHSPYYFFPNASNDIALNYRQSIDYSFNLYQQIYDYLQTTHQPFILVYVSDHGEFTGEGGQYGHNCFEPMVYRVPMFIVSNRDLPDGYQAIRSHYHLSQLIRYLLGYEENLVFSRQPSIVNGTMLSREDGFRVMKSDF